VFHRRLGNRNQERKTILRERGYDSILFVYRYMQRHIETLSSSLLLFHSIDLQFQQTALLVYLSVSTASILLQSTITMPMKRTLIPLKLTGCLCYFAHSTAGYVGINPNLPRPPQSPTKRFTRNTVDTTTIGSLVVPTVGTGTISWSSDSCK
jgi:hypothetical protein